MSHTNPHFDGRPVVLHVVNTFARGGTEKMLVQLLRRFDTRCVRHVVVTLRDAGPLASELPDDVACHAIGLQGRARLGFVQLARVIRHWNAVVVHARNTSCWSDTALAALVTPGATAVLGFHGLDQAEGLSVRTRRVASLAARLGASFTSVSRQGALLLNREAGVPMESIAVLRNGVDTDAFTPPDDTVRAAAKAHLGMPTDSFVVGTVGSLTPVKRHDVLIEAFAHLQRQFVSAQLVIAGDGPLRGHIFDRIEQCGLVGRVHLVGRQDDIPCVLAAMDAYVCCSDFEGVSNALLEAMACGIPVVTTLVGDHGEIVRHEQNGLHTSVGSVRELAEAMGKLAQCIEYRTLLGRAGRLRTNNMSLRDAVWRYERFYRAHLPGGLAGFARERTRSDAVNAPVWPQGV